MSATILLPVQRVLDNLNTEDILSHCDDGYLELSMRPYPNREICKLFAEYGYWETHDFGSLGHNQNDKYLDTYKGYKFGDPDNKNKYRSSMLAFWENREVDIFYPDIISSKLYLKVLKGRIVAIGTLLQNTNKITGIPFGADKVVNTQCLGKLHLFVPRRCRNKGYASELVEYIDQRIKTYVTNTVPVIQAMGRALELLQSKLSCPVTARSIEHCSYSEHVQKQIINNYMNISKTFGFNIVKPRFSELGQCLSL